MYNYKWWRINRLPRPLTGEKEYCRFAPAFSSLLLCDQMITTSQLINDKFTSLESFWPPQSMRIARNHAQPWCIPFRFRLIRLRLSFQSIGYLFHARLFWTSPRCCQFFPHCTFQKEMSICTHPLIFTSAKTLLTFLTLKPCTIRPGVTSRFHVIVTQTPDALRYHVSLLFHESVIYWPNLMFPTCRYDMKRFEESKA